MPVFKIVKFDLIGKVLYTSQEMPELEERTINNRPEYFYKGTNEKYPTSHLWKLTSTKKQDAFSSTNKYLPFYADVTEDVSPQYKKVAKTYKNCQLMTEKHGGYLQFYHPPTNHILRIAMNSHFYTPIN